MSAKKEPVEIYCSECDSRFRLWIPAESITEWERGVRISCVRCGAYFFVKKSRAGFEISALKEAAHAPQPKDEPKQAAEPLRQAAERQEVKPQPQEAQTEERDTILVVEDDRLSRDMVENTLSDTGFRIVSVKNAAEAMRTLKKERVSLIVTDLYLKNPADPESLLDGEELLKRVQDSGISVPAVITTGKDIIDDIVLDPKWFDLQVKGFIQKGNPFWIEELKLKVKEIVYKG